MNINGYDFPDELHYDRNHQWLRLEGELAATGLDAYTADQAGEIAFVDLPRPGLSVTQGQTLGSVESGKWVGRIVAPISGVVRQVNQALADDPRPINADPYGQWLCRIAPSALEAELPGLLRGPALRDFISAELARLDECPAFPA